MSNQDQEIAEALRSLLKSVRKLRIVTKKMADGKSTSVERLWVLGANRVDKT